MKRHIRLPNGRPCGLPVYCASWRAVKLLPPDARVAGWDHFRESPEAILRDLLFGLHDRINRHDPRYGVGRKWSDDYQVEISRAARALNTPRLAIHWLPPGLRERFQERLR